MAAIHLARWDGEGAVQKWFAIKTILPEYIQNDQIIKMFIDEVRTVARINHPNVVHVFGFGNDDGRYWMAMEYLHGETVGEIQAHLMDAGTSLNPGLAVRIVADAAAGLHAAHELRGRDGEPLNLVHRDVSPRNLFLTYDGTVKVIDFGVADGLGRLANTEDGLLKGSIPYISPERMTGLKSDRGADIFALGVVLWELTTGRRLFLGHTHSQTIDRVVECNVPLPSTLIDDYPLELEAVVMRALSKNPDLRFRTAGEMSRALESYLMNTNQLVGPEELSAYASRIFACQLVQRNKRLAWAADLTHTLSGNPGPSDSENPPQAHLTQQDMQAVGDDDDAPTTRFEPPACGCQRPGQLQQPTPQTAARASSANRPTIPCRPPKVPRPSGPPCRVPRPPRSVEGFPQFYHVSPT
jgi:eukaryotic-like serine/threonine-protein kinase